MFRKWSVRRCYPAHTAKPQNPYVCWTGAQTNQTLTFLSVSAFKHARSKGWQGTPGNKNCWAWEKIKTQVCFNFSRNRHTKIRDQGHSYRFLQYQFFPSLHRGMFGSFCKGNKSSGCISVDIKPPVTDFVNVATAALETLGLPIFQLK